MDDSHRGMEASQDNGDKDEVGERRDKREESREKREERREEGIGKREERREKRGEATTEVGPGYRQLIVKSFSSREAMIASAWTPNSRFHGFHFQ